MRPLVDNTIVINHTITFITKTNGLNCCCLGSHTWHAHHERSQNRCMEHLHKLYWMFKWSQERPWRWCFYPSDSYYPFNVAERKARPTLMSSECVFHGGMRHGLQTTTQSSWVTVSWELGSNHIIINSSTQWPLHTEPIFLVEPHKSCASRPTAQTDPADPVPENTLFWNHLHKGGFK